MSRFVARRNRAAAATDLLHTLRELLTGSQPPAEAAVIASLENQSSVQAESPRLATCWIDKLQLCISRTLLRDGEQTAEIRHRPRDAELA
jgi:hypothetical protein